MSESRAVLQSLRTSNERRSVEEIDSLIDEEAQQLNHMLFQGDGQNRVFVVRTLADYTAAVTLEEMSVWKGNVCIAATGDELMQINRFISSTGLSPVYHSPEGYEQFPTEFANLTQLRVQAMEYEAKVEELFSLRTVEVETVAEMETLVGIPDCQRLKVLIITSDQRTKSLIRLMAQENGITMVDGKVTAVLEIK